MTLGALAHQVLSPAAERALLERVVARSVRSEDGAAAGTEGVASGAPGVADSGGAAGGAPFKEADRAREKLIRRNLRLVAREARRFYVPQGAAYDRDDLFQAGVTGLIHAIETFDPERGCRLSTYAVPWIRQRMRRFADYHASTIRVPADVRADIARVHRAETRLAGEISAESDLPDEASLAKSLGLPERRVANARRAYAVSTPASLDAPAGDHTPHGSSLARTLADAFADHAEEEEQPEASTVAREARDEMEERLRKALAALPGELREVVRLRFGLGDGDPMTFTEIGRAMKTSHETARKREARALSRLKDLIGQDRAMGGEAP